MINTIVNLKNGKTSDATEVPTNWAGIMKCQRPLVGNVESPPCLFYNESRSLLFAQTLSASDMKRIFPNGDPKTFWHVEIVDSVLRFDMPAVMQSW